MGQDLTSTQQEEFRKQRKIISTTMIILMTIVFGLIAFLPSDPQTTQTGSTTTQTDSSFPVLIVLIIIMVTTSIAMVIVSKKLKFQRIDPTLRRNIMQKQSDERMYNQIRTQQDRARYEKEQNNIFGKDSLRGDLMSKVCKKCYSALDADGKCPQCSFK